MTRAKTNRKGKQAYILSTQSSNFWVCPYAGVSSIIDATVRDIQEMKMTNLISLHSNIPTLQHTLYPSKSCTNKSSKMPKGTVFSSHILHDIQSSLSLRKSSHSGKYKQVSWCKAKKCQADLQYTAIKALQVATVVLLLIHRLCRTSFAHISSFPDLDK
jgi:hypothetical protein